MLMVILTAEGPGSYKINTALIPTVTSRDPPKTQSQLPESISRRRCLQLASLTVGGVVATSGGADAATKRRGISFERTVNIVDDFGADPSGSEPINDALEKAADDGTLVVFPSGTYQFAGSVELTNYSTVGVLGDGDVTFVPPAGFNDRLIEIAYRTKNALIEGVTVDLSADDTTAGFRTEVSRRAVLQSISFEGRGTHPDADVVNAFSIESTDTEAVTVIRDVNVPKGSSLAGYGGGKGRSAIWAGPGMKGTLRVVNCYFAEFGNNGVYASKTPGDVEVIDCLFENNNIASVRISGRGSFVRGTTIDLDVSDYNGSTGGAGYNLRGIWTEQGSYDYPSGVRVEGCDIRVVQTDGSAGGIVAGGSAKELVVEDSRVFVDEDETLGISRHSPDKSPNRLVVDNVSITGAASRNAAIWIEGTTDSVVKNSCISQPNRDGVQLIDATDPTVNRSTISVGGTQIVDKNTSVSRWEIDSSGSCPLPSNVTSSELYKTLEVRGIGGYTKYSIGVDNELVGVSSLEGGDDISGTTATGGVYDGGADVYEYKWNLTDVSVVSGSTHDIRIFAGNEEVFLNHLEVSADEYTEYAIEVSGDIAPGDRANSGDTGGGGVAEGVVEGGTDTFRFSGDVTDVRVTDGSRDQLEVTINGEPYAERTLKIKSRGGHVAYHAKVTGDIFEGPLSNGGDTAGDGYAEGELWNGGMDSYRFYGWLGTVDAVEGDRSDMIVTVDGERPWKELELQGSGWVEYELEVTGEVATNSSIEGPDSASGTTASGAVGSGGSDSYKFTGDLADVAVTTGSKSDLTVLVNGNERSI